MHFLLIYCKDTAHASPSFEPAQGEAAPRPGVREDLPAYVRGALKQFRLGVPCVIDAEDSAAAAYRASPQRLVVVDAAGRIALDAGLGLPDGWDWAEVEACLVRLEAGPSRAPSPPRSASSGS